MAFSGAGVLYIGSLLAGYSFLGDPPKTVLSTGIEYLQPTKDDRQLHTSNLHIFLRERHYQPLNLKLRAGVGISRVTGQITQLTGSFEEGTLRSETLDSPAWGAGPEIEASFSLLKLGRFSTGIDLLGGVFLYDRAFPAGGQRYNGVLQAGVHAALALSDRDTLTLTWRWMHVSNGQGLKPSNPGYDARGAGLRYTHAF
jgi:hypothetical protein